MNREKLSILADMNQRSYHKEDIERKGLSFCQGVIDSKQADYYKPEDLAHERIKPQIYKLSKPAKRKFRSAGRVKGWVAPEERVNHGKVS